MGAPVRTKPAHIANREACLIIAKAFSLSRGDRLELATVILNQNVESWRDLDPAQISRLRDALEGAVLVCNIQTERRRGTRV